jgi:hypothetical protein
LVKMVKRGSGKTYGEQSDGVDCKLVQLSEISFSHLDNWSPRYDGRVDSKQFNGSGKDEENVLGGATGFLNASMPRYGWLQVSSGPKGSSKAFYQRYSVFVSQSP